MTVPRFDPRHDAEPAVRAGWLRPGEHLTWTRYAHTITFAVPGRNNRGAVLKQSPWRTAGRQALAVADGAITVLDFFASGSGSDPSRPEVLVFGTHIDCRAATLMATRAAQSFWVLTDQRFAEVRFDGTSHTVWELPSAEFAHQPTVKRNRALYERIGFSDGSLIDFRHREPGRLAASR